MNVLANDLYFVTMFFRTPAAFQQLLKTDRVLCNCRGGRRLGSGSVIQSTNFNSRLTSKWIRTFQKTADIRRNTQHQRSSCYLSTFIHPIHRCHHSTVTEGVPSAENERIYYGTLTPYIKAVKVFSLSASILGLSMQPYLMSQAADMPLGVLVAVGSIVSFFVFVNPLLLHWITKKYVVEMNYSSETETYFATVMTFFLRRKMISFTVSDVVVPEIPGMFATFTAKGIPLFVEPQMFNHPHHYGILMGYDKPIDFHLGKQDEASFAGTVEQTEQKSKDSRKNEKKSV